MELFNIICFILNTYINKKPSPMGLGLIKIGGNLLSRKLYNRYHRQ